MCSSDLSSVARQQTLEPPEVFLSEWFTATVGQTLSRAEAVSAVPLIAWQLARKTLSCPQDLPALTHVCGRYETTSQSLMVHLFNRWAFSFVITTAGLFSSKVPPVESVRPRIRFDSQPCYT